MEALPTYKQKLLNSNVFTNTLEYLDLRNLLDMRLISAKIADSHVPACQTHLRYKCTNEGENAYIQFAKKMKKIRKVEITNINGSVEHALQIEELGKDREGELEYLHIEFDGPDNPAIDSDDIAR
jgi:hypothetical protein